MTLLENQFVDEIDFLNTNEFTAYFICLDDTIEIYHKNKFVMCIDTFTDSNRCINYCKEYLRQYKLNELLWIVE